MDLDKIIINTASPGVPRGRILIVYTGGTLGMVYDEEGALRPFDFRLILEYLPILKNLRLELTVVSFRQPLDSSNIGPHHWKVIAEIVYKNYLDQDGFVVLHGTDTMAFTASALSFMFEGLSKPIVFTGAQLPISDPRSDARENLITALEIASSKEEGRAIVPEVCIYFDYVLLRGNRSKKVESMQFDAFDSGNYPPLAKAGVKIDYNQTAIQHNDTNLELRLLTKFDTRIALIKLFPGIGQESVVPVLTQPDLKGVVLETYGAGNVPTLPWLMDCLKEALDRGIIIVNISQCVGGMVTQGRYETSKKLEQIGVIGGYDMTTEAMVAKLMILLGEYGPEQTRERIAQPLSGEMSH